ncbi:MAG: AraC family transcriptional regulator [Pseudomonadota bacterium]
MKHKVVSEDWMYFEGQVAEDAEDRTESLGDDGAVVVMHGIVGCHNTRIPKNDFVSINLQRNCAGDLQADYNGEKYHTSLIPGNISICPPSVEQEYGFTGWLESTLLLVETSIFDRVVELDPTLPSIHSVQPMSNICRPRLARMVEEQYRIQSSGDVGWKVLSEANNLRIALEILMTFSNVHKGQSTAASLGDGELRALNDFIDNKLSSNFSLSELATVLDRSPLQMARAFKATTGETPYRYVLLRRIEHARALLTSSSKSLAEIAYECGFASQSHMTTVFSDKLGITPGRYRKMAMS